MSDPIPPAPAYAPRVVPDPAPASPPGTPPPVSNHAATIGLGAGVAISTNDTYIRAGEDPVGDPGLVSGAGRFTAGYTYSPNAVDNAKKGDTARGVTLVVEAELQGGGGNTPVALSPRVGIDGVGPVGGVVGGARVGMLGDFVNGPGLTTEAHLGYRATDSLEIGAFAQINHQPGSATVPGKNYSPLGVDYQTPSRTVDQNRTEILIGGGAVWRF